jgi:hypothetical protein
MSTGVQRIAPGRILRLAAALAVSAIGLAGCSLDDAGTEDDTVADPDVTAASSAARSTTPDVDGNVKVPVLNGDAILILDQMTDVNGDKVRRRSFIGDSAFCPGGP